MNGISYPPRPNHWAHRYCRLLTKTCAAQDIGHVAFVLCVTIAHQEDAKRYRGAVTFFNEQLMPLIGVTKWESLDRARERAVERGWLHYEPGNRGQRMPGRYWVTIPTALRDLDDGPCDENQYPENGDWNGQSQSPAKGEWVESQYPAKGDREGERRGDREGEHSSLSLKECPNSRPDVLNSGGRKRPKPPPSPEDQATAEWIWTAIQTMQPDRKAPNLVQWANSIRLMRERDGRTDQDIRAVFSWAHRHSFWRTNILSPDKLREKFDDLRLQMRRGGSGTQPQTSSTRQAEIARREQAIQRQQERKSQCPNS